MEQATILLKNLIEELEDISVEKKEDWSKVKNWIAKATPSIRKYFSEFFVDFQEVSKPPRWRLPRYNSFSMNTMTGETSGTPVTYFHEENTQLTEASRNDVLNFLKGILDTTDSSKQEVKTFEAIDTKKVFIVHGHDDLVTQKVARFLEKIELEPIILHEQASRNRTIIEKLEHYSDVAFAVVLLTPDDVGALATEKDNLKPRARQNVILELGYMMAKLGRHNVCALLKDSVEKPSDYDGVIYISMDAGGAWKQELIKELKDAGIDGNFAKLYS